VSLNDREAKKNIGHDSLSPPLLESPLIFCMTSSLSEIQLFFTTVRSALCSASAEMLKYNTDGRV
jgi:hypothetical protein